MLKVQSISKIFGGVTALEDVSLSICRGDITGVIGPNGAGKTTLFNIITGIYTQTYGRVILNNSDVSGLPPEKLARLHGAYFSERGTVWWHDRAGKCHGRTA